jgi:hypothetical protein
MTETNQADAPGAVNLTRKRGGPSFLSDIDGLFTNLVSETYREINS